MKLFLILILMLPALTSAGWYVSDNTAINIAKEVPVFLNYTNDNNIFLTHPKTESVPCYLSERIKVININDVDVKFSLSLKSKTCLYIPVTEQGSLFVISQFKKTNLIVKELMYYKGNQFTLTFNNDGYKDSIQQLQTNKNRLKNAL